MQKKKKNLKYFIAFFNVNRALSKIDQLFGESTGCAASDEEVAADLAAGKRLKKTVFRTKFDKQLQKTKFLNNHKANRKVIILQL